MLKNQHLNFCFGRDYWTTKMVIKENRRWFILHNLYWFSVNYTNISTTLIILKKVKFPLPRENTGKLFVFPWLFPYLCSQNPMCQYFKVRFLNLPQRYTINLRFTRNISFFWRDWCYMAQQLQEELRQLIVVLPTRQLQKEYNQK